MAQMSPLVVEVFSRYFGTLVEQGLFWGQVGFLHGLSSRLACACSHRVLAQWFFQSAFGRNKASCALGVVPDVLKSLIEGAFCE